jgi:transposase
MDSSRRRGRPKRASEEQKQQLKQLQRELAAHREYMSAQDQAREAATATLGGRSGTAIMTLRSSRGSAVLGSD